MKITGEVFIGNMKAQFYNKGEDEITMGNNKKRRHLLNRTFAIILALTLILSNFSTAALSKEVAAADENGPGGVKDGLISWVDVEQSAEMDGTNITSLIDLVDNKSWEKETDNPYIPNAMNFNGGLQTEKAMYTRSANDFNIEDPAREVFSIQSSDGKGFPWEFGGKGSTALYNAKDNTINTYFGRTNAINVEVDNYELKDGAMLNIWSAENDWALSLNGNTLDKTADNTTQFATDTSGGRYYIGAGHSSRFNGMIAETILFDRKLNDDERSKVNSYLALKYGLTLKDDNDNSIDYVASDGSPMWEANNNEGYGNRITGIGRDENGNLSQKQSISQINGANLTIALGNEIKETNQANSEAIANDKSFFIFSDNGMSTAFHSEIENEKLPADLKHRNDTTKSTKQMDRVFKVDKTNWKDTDITLQVDDVNIADQEFYLYILDTNVFIPVDKETGKVTRNSNVLSDGSSFTFILHVNKKDLESEVRTSENLQEDNYISGWEEFQTALKEAQDVLTDADKTQNEVNETLSALQEARNNLEKKEELNLNIHSPSEQVDTSQPEFNGIVTEGADVTLVIKDQDGNIIENIGGTAEVNDDTGLWTYTPVHDLPDGSYTVEVTATKDGASITETKDFRIYTTDKEKLEKLVDATNDIENDGYTEESWKYFQDKLNNAKEVLDNENATQDEVDKAYEDLQDAFLDLEKTKPENPVDKSLLEDLKTNIDNKELQPEDYTSKTWDGLEHALENAENVLNNDQASQEEVDQALKNLADAYTNLQPAPVVPKVDKSLLEELTKDIHDKDLSEDAYTPESWNNLEDALHHADVVFNDENATQEDVDQAFLDLTDAYANLKEVDPEPVVDKSLLEKLKSNIENKDLAEGDYTSDSWNALEEALNNAREVLNNDQATQEEVDQALKDLANAYTNLQPAPGEPAVDKSLLEGLTNDVYGKDLSEDAYTPDSWKNLEDTLHHAENVLANENATQEDVDQAFLDLTDAYANLKVIDPEPVVDKSLLEKLTNDILGKNLPAEVYTSESWKALEDALNHAQTVLADENATQEEVDTALGQLIEAYTNLKEIEKAPEVNKQLLENLVKDSNNLSKEAYTDKSWLAFEKALHAAKDVLNNPNVTQAEVNDQVEKLVAAFKALQPVKEEKPEADKSDLQDLIDKIRDENLSDHDYTQDSWNDLESALQQAEKELNDAKASSQDIKNALSSLESAYQKLEQVKPAPSGSNAQGEKLPRTATNMYTNAFIGTLILVAGFLLLFGTRRKKIN